MFPHVRHNRSRVENRCATRHGAMIGSQDREASDGAVSERDAA
jgi:hypothetical protein